MDAPTNGTATPKTTPKTGSPVFVPHRQSIMAQLEAFRAAAFRDDLREINRRLAKEMGIALARLKQLVEAGEIKTVSSGPRSKRIPWCEVQRWMGDGEK